MKWSEFKQIVDDKLDGEDPEIGYIDVSDPSKEYIHVAVDDTAMDIT